MNKTPRTIDLALQGGASHGAFTWGVLDCLLEDASLRFAGISGTSAGALNAAVLATGLARGGNQGARDALREFWRDVSRSGGCFGAVPGLGASPLWPGSSWTPAAFFGAWARSFSPYEFNPLDLNPLRDAVRRHVDEAALRGDGPKLFVTATACAPASRASSAARRCRSTRCSPRPACRTCFAP